VCRIDGKVVKAAVFATVACAVRLAAIVTGALTHGLVGVSVALFVVMCAEGLYALPALRSALRRGRSRPADPVRTPHPAHDATPA
jgi:hypothetical protein